VVERGHIQPELDGVPAQVAVFERLSPAEQQLVQSQNRPCRAAASAAAAAASACG
jgi:hypothetical protein